MIKSGTGDTRWGVRAVIGGSSYDWYGAGAGGVAYVGSFNWNSDTPCFIFPQQLLNGDEKDTAEATSHEVGHTVGLYHDGRTSPAEGYYQGQGNWAPIMGVGYYKSLVQWSKADLIITFGENVQTGSGNVVIKKSVNGSTVETIDVTDVAKVSISGAQATINPATTLWDFTEYYVEVDAGAFKDLADNSFAGISGSDAWKFTTLVVDNLDVDGNGTADALTDGILTLRYLFDPNGMWNYSDALGANSTRTSRAQIRDFLDSFNPDLTPPGLQATESAGQLAESPTIPAPAAVTAGEEKGDSPLLCEAPGTDRRLVWPFRQKGAVPFYPDRCRGGPGRAGGRGHRCGQHGRRRGRGDQCGAGRCRRRGPRRSGSVGKS